VHVLLVQNEFQVVGDGLVAPVDLQEQAFAPADDFSARMANKLVAQTGKLGEPLT